MEYTKRSNGRRIKLHQMKFWNPITITAIIESIILVFFLVVPVIILDKSWWWFFTPFLIVLGGDMIAGFIVAVVKFAGRKKPDVEKIDKKGAMKAAVYEMMHEKENPDNFKIISDKIKSTSNCIIINFEAINFEIEKI